MQNKLKISLCLIVWNELKGCECDVPQIPREDFFEVIAIDGGSSDGTVEYLERNNIKVFQQPNPGLNAAYVFANSIARGDAVVVFFPKGTLPTKDVLKFRPLFDLGNDLVIASRKLEGSSNEEDTNIFKPRKWAVLILAYFVAFMWCRKGYFVRDVLHGFKGWKRNAFYKMKILDVGLSIDVEMVIRAYKLQLMRAEFPTQELSRGYGETHFKVWPTGKKLLRYLLFEFRRSD
jgi:glycosyltransferase involved in cell wall biosynthesis